MISKNIKNYSLIYILLQIWKQYYKHTILNISQQDIYDKGFKYYTNLGISIQGANARRTLKELINIIKIKNYSMELKITLKNDEVIRFII